MTQAKDSYIKMIQREFKYNFYLFCKPYLLLLEDDLIIDANLIKSENKSTENLLIIESTDSFFLESISMLDDKDFIITLQCYDLNDNFSYQIESYGENFIIEENKFSFECQSIFTNQINPTLNPNYKNAIELYKSERVSYIRNSKIENILY